MSEGTPLTEQSPAWVELKLEVRELKAGLIEASKTAKRTESALLGTYDESGTTWKKGVREQVYGLTTIAKWIGAIATAIFIAASADFLNSYFGLWGASHAARILSGGH